LFHYLANPSHLFKLGLQLFDLSQDLLESRDRGIGIVDEISGTVVLCSCCVLSLRIELHMRPVLSTLHVLSFITTTTMTTAIIFSTEFTTYSLPSLLNRVHQAIKVI
jgi:hypothetical protein